MPPTLDAGERHITQLFATFHQKFTSPSLTALVTRNPAELVGPLPGQLTIPEDYVLSGTDVAIIIAMSAVVAAIVSVATIQSFFHKPCSEPNTENVALTDCIGFSGSSARLLNGSAPGRQPRSGC
jgi:hypothetical protein